MNPFFVNMQNLLTYETYMLTLFSLHLSSYYRYLYKRRYNFYLY